MIRGAVRPAATRLVALGMLAGGVAVLAVPQSPASPTAEWVARQAQDRDTGRDSRMSMRMKLFDRHGRVRACAHDRGAPRPGAGIGIRRRSPADRFTHQTTSAARAFVWEHPKADDERFLYLRRRRRAPIAGAETRELRRQRLHTNIGVVSSTKYATHAGLENGATPPDVASRRPPSPPGASSHTESVVRRVPARRLVDSQGACRRCRGHLQPPQQKQSTPSAAPSRFKGLTVMHPR